MNASDEAFVLSERAQDNSHAKLIRNLYILVHICITYATPTSTPQGNFKVQVHNFIFVHFSNSKDMVVCDMDKTAHPVNKYTSHYHFTLFNFQHMSLIEIKLSHSF